MSSFVRYARATWPKAAVSFDQKDEHYDAAIKRFPGATGYRLIKLITIFTNEHRLCVLCKESTILEYYMVHDALWWSTVGWSECGEVCIGCFEKRLGRQLTRADFTDVPVNGDLMEKSDRLNNRLEKVKQ